MRRKRKPSMMDPIRRGTTPTIFFDMPYPTEYIESGFITFKQRGELVFEKSFKDDCVEVREDNRISVELTQKETLLLTEVDVCSVQINFLLLENRTAASGIYKIPVLENLKGGEYK